MLYFSVNLSPPEKRQHSDLFWSIFSGIRTEYAEFGVSHRIHSKFGKIPTRVTPDTDTFYAVHNVNPYQIMSVHACVSIETIPMIVFHSIPLTGFNIFVRLG